MWTRSMLGEFQQALADLVASPDLCRRVRANPAELRDHYDLTEREHERLVGMVNQRGMTVNCMLYRANRLAPLALNLPKTCRALGPRLAPLLSEYVALHPKTDVHFYIECDRFCGFLEAKIDQGYDLEEPVKSALANESAAVRLHLVASYSAI